MTVTVRQLAECVRGEVLGDGDLGVALRVCADRVTRQAREKIEAAGGSVEELLPRKEKKAVAAAEESKPAAAGEESSG